MNNTKLLFSFEGIVEKNKGRGKKLGYPTANISISPDLPEGIFVGYTTYQNKKFPSLIFIGPSITFEELDKKAEIYLLDFDGDLYEQFLQVDVEKKLRDNQKFESEVALINQMLLDEEAAEEYFKEFYDRTK